MRYELKYAVEHLSHEAIIAQLMNHPASFRELYPDRQVNNYYFDTPGFHCFHQNVEGHPRRKKMRLRWYGDNHLPTQHSVLELKNKDKELGWKDTFKIDHKITDGGTLVEAVKSAGQFKSELNPVLKNTYLRSYLLSQDGKYRVTIDRQQAFAIPFTNMSHLQVDALPVVVELKFEAADVEGAQYITDYLPYRQTKNSKYATGVELLYL